MDPYLEHPSLWPDVHNSLIAAIRDALVPEVTPRYYVRLERRTYLLSPDDIVFVGRPDLAVVTDQETETTDRLPLATAGVVNITVPIADEVDEFYLQVHEVSNGELVTILELLSPANKLQHQGREDYERTRVV